MTSNNLTSIQDIHTAINTVNDPEYPGISIVDLGLLENIEINTADEAVSYTHLTLPTIYSV